MVKEKTEEDLVQRKCARFPEMVDFPKFAHLLRLDENNITAQHLFKITDKVSLNIKNYKKKKKNKTKKNSISFFYICTTVNFIYII
jgi:hypothetical protein